MRAIWEVELTGLDGTEQWEKEREASFVLKSVAWVTVWWWHCFLRW